MNFLTICLWLNRSFPMVFLWFSYGFPMLSSATRVCNPTMVFRSWAALAGSKSSAKPAPAAIWRNNVINLAGYIKICIYIYIYTQYIYIYVCVYYMLCIYIYINNYIYICVYYNINMCVCEWIDGHGDIQFLRLFCSSKWLLSWT